MEIQEQIRKKAQEDPAFSAALKAAGNAEEVQKVLLAAGFQLTEEERKDMSKAGCVALSDEELDKVVGGFFFFFF